MLKEHGVFAHSVRCSIGSVRPNEWSSALPGVVAQTKIIPASSAKTRPDTAGDVNGLTRDAIEALPAAVYMTDAEGRLTFYNEAAAALWGYHPELGETKFCGSWKLYWPDGTRLPHDQCPMAMALHQRRPIRGMEAVAERPDGTRISFIPYPTPLFDEAGRLTGAVNMLVDISERKQVEADLAERKAQLAMVEARRELVDSEARFRATFENAAVGVALVGPDGTILRANNSFARMLGYSVEELRTRTFQDFTHPDDLATNLSVLDKTLVGEADSYSMEKRYVRRDGGVVWASLTVGCVRKTDGGVDYLVSVIQDITVRKQAEARLQKGERKLCELLGALPAAVYVTDSAGHITYCNQSAINLWGFEPTLGIDKWCDISKFYYADGSPMPLGQ